MATYLKEVKERPKEDLTAQYATREASIKIAEVCERAANYENMVAHGLSCTHRLEKWKK